MLKKIVNYIFADIKFKFRKRPTHMNYPFSSVCNHKCIMCNVHLRNTRSEIPISVLEKIIDDPLFDDITGIGLSGGEPFMVPNIYDYIKTLINKLPSLKSISINSNASLPKKIEKELLPIVNLCKKNNINFNFVISLDGIRKIHNISRGKNSAWEQAEKSIEILSRLNINRNILMTIHNKNVDDLFNVWRYGKKNNINVYYGIAVVIDRLNNQSLQSEFLLTQQDKFKVWQHLQKVNQEKNSLFTQKIWYNHLSNQLVYGTNRKATCKAQNKSVYLSEDGKISYCAVYDKAIETNNKKSLLANYNSKTNKNIQKYMIENICKDCHHTYQNVPRFIDLMNLILNRPIIKFITNLMKYSLTEINVFRRISKKNNLKDSVLIIGCYGSETVGDKAILGGIIYYIQKYTEQKIDILSNNYTYTLATISEMEFINTNVVDDKHVRKKIRNYSAVIFGGGPIMGYRNTILFSKIFKLARKHKVQSVIWGCGFGPFRTKSKIENIYKNIAREMVKKASFVGFRELDSISYFNNNKNANAMFLPDPALRWISKAKNINGNKKRNKLIRIGVSFRTWPENNKGSDYRNLLNGKITVIANFINSINKENEYEFVFLPMNTFYIGGDDRINLNKIFDLCENQNSITLLNNIVTPHDVLLSMETCDLFIGMRYHSVIFSTGLGIPTIGIDYVLPEGKVTNYMKMINMLDYCIKIKELDQKLLIEKFNTLIENPKIIKIELMSKNKEFLEREKNIFKSRIKKLI